MNKLAALLVGCLFGFGLTLSGMTEPNNVIAFLTLTSNWNPALALVMGSALLVTALGYPWVTTRGAPMFDTDFHLPTSQVVDGRLLGGAGLFGIGWGIAGFCPGPAIVGAFTLDERALVFMLAYLVGNSLYEMLLNPNQQTQAIQPD